MLKYQHSNIFRYAEPLRTRSERSATGIFVRFNHTGSGNRLISGTRGLLSATKQQCLDPQTVGVETETHDRPHGTTGARSETWRNSSRARIDEMCTSTTGADDRRHRIAQRHRRMGISAGIEHHAVVTVPSACDATASISSPSTFDWKQSEPDGRDRPLRSSREIAPRKPGRPVDRRHRAAPAN